jgi:hemoglobin
MSIDEQEDSVHSTSYQAAGELVGITQLVDEFYANMDRLPEANVIRDMHPPNLAESRKKLTYFLCGWLGGPRLFQQHYGPISIPGAHKRFPIGYEERDAWLLCMQRALAASLTVTNRKTTSWLRSVSPPNEFGK